jgi:hypothetical protein
LRADVAQDAGNQPGVARRVFQRMDISVGAVADDQGDTAGGFRRGSVLGRQRGQPLARDLPR